MYDAQECPDVHGILAPLSEPGDYVIGPSRHKRSEKHAYRLTERLINRYYHKRNRRTFQTAINCWLIAYLMVAFAHGPAHAGVKTDTPIAFAATSKELKEIRSTTGLAARLGVSAIGDAPPMNFYRTESACSTNSGKGDEGTEVPAAAGGCWKAIYKADFDLREFGAKCDGLTDDAMAIAAADEAASRLPNGRVLFPAASCSIGSPITIPDYVTWQGRGSVQTAILVSFPTGDAIIGHDAVQIREMGFAAVAAVSRSAGAFVTFTGSGDLLDDFSMKGYVVGIRLAGTSTKAPVTAPTVNNGKFFQPSITTPDSTAAIVVQNFSSASLTTITISGYSNSMAPAHSILVRNGDTLFIDNINATLHGTFAVTPASGEASYAMRVTNALFDSAGVGTGRAGIDACVLGGGGRILDTQMSNVWCGLSTGTGLLVAPASGGVVHGLDIVNLQAVGNRSTANSVANSGIKLDSSLGGTVAYVNITGGCSSGNENPNNSRAAWALWLAGPTSHIGIANFIGGNCDGRGKNSNGVKIDQSVDYVRLNAADFSGNVGVNYANSSHGSHFLPKDLATNMFQ